MRVKIGFVFAVAAAALLWVAPEATAVPDMSKYRWVCHQTGGGEFHLLVTGLRAALQHADSHGDAIYEYVFNMPPPCPE